MQPVFSRGGGSIDFSGMANGTARRVRVADLLGLSGKPWVLAVDRTNWEFGKTTIEIPMVSAI